MSKPPRDCPCFSGLRYVDCCGPLHRGTKEPESATALMRSRYAAFAIGDVEYVVRTISKDHEDRAKPKDALLLALRLSTAARFLGLTILDSAEEGEHSLVLFFAKIFERGRDRSFAELSTFTREDGAYRYRRGELLPKDALPTDWQKLDIASYRKLTPEKASERD